MPRATIPNHWPMGLLRVLRVLLGRRRFEARIQDLKRFEKDRQADTLLRSKSRNYGCLEQSVLRQLTPVNQSLVLASQIQRSGGSLLAQLFDGHPQLHAHPHELKIGYPDKDTWPDLDLEGDPRRWFRLLFEDMVPKFFRHGYTKEGPVSDAPLRYRFHLVPRLQRDVFLHCLRGAARPDYRAVLDAYMTSYFNAWLNYGNWTGDKKYVTGFTPGLAARAEGVARFFAVYPEGRLISIVRDPFRWYPSAARLKPERFGVPEAGSGRWAADARAMVENHIRYPGRVLILRFEDLVLETGATMEAVAQFLGIGFHPCLTEPTFNNQPMRANSSFAVTGCGISRETATREVELPQDVREHISRHCGPVYEEVLARARRIA